MRMGPGWDQDEIRMGSGWDWDGIRMGAEDAGTTSTSVPRAICLTPAVWDAQVAGKSPALQESPALVGRSALRAPPEAAPSP